MPDDQNPLTPDPAAAPPAQAEVLTYVGVIDRLLQGRLSGWAVTIHGDPCDVLIRVNDVVVATVLSDGPRPDLHAKQQSRGLGGWGIGIGAQLTDGENRIEAFLPDGTQLRGSPLIHDTNAGDGVIPIEATGPKTYIGAIDTFDQPIIFGWAVGSDTSEASVVVRVNDGDPIAIPANLTRPDLIAKQLAQSGGGWRIAIAELLAPGMNRISITYPDGTHLPGSPFERTAEGMMPAAASPAPAPSLFGRARKQPPAQEPANAAGVAAPAPVAPPPAQASTPAPAPARAPAPAPAQAPARAPTPAPSAAPSNVTPFPARSGGRGGMPSLPELDEVSLDDLAHAIAAGIIDVPAPPAPEPIPDPMEIEAEHVARTAQPHRPGFLSRLFGRG